MEWLVQVAKVTGVAGLAVGAVFLAWKELLKALGPGDSRNPVTATHKYRLIRLFMILAFIVGVFGILLWQNPLIVTGHGNTVVR